MPAFPSILFSLASFVSCSLSAQTLPLVVKSTLPAILDETSGVEVNNRNSIWSHNDSGGKPELYNLDSTGTLLRTLAITNASNIDWEEMTQDEQGNFYIGDFGNNNNKRTDLKIYKIPNPSVIKGNTVEASVISFTYPDQPGFPPADSLKNFDMEAMFAINHHLYLFSKNRTRPYNGFTKLYRLPDEPGTYTAELLDSLYIPWDTAYWVNITSADISPDGSRIALLNAKTIRVFSNFTGEHFFSGNMHTFTFEHMTQKEAVCFITSDELYITDEFNDPPTGGQHLYYADLRPYLTPGKKK
jgi:hypothetical protein